MKLSRVWLTVYEYHDLIANVFGFAIGLAVEACFPLTIVCQTFAFTIETGREAVHWSPRLKLFHILDEVLAMSFMLVMH